MPLKKSNVTKYYSPLGLAHLRNGTAYVYVCTCECSSDKHDTNLASEIQINITSSHVTTGISIMCFLWTHSVFPSYASLNIGSNNN